MMSFLRSLFRLSTAQANFYCPICKESSESFLPFGFTYLRPYAMCPHCRSLERHRLFWLFLEQKTDFFYDRYCVLDIAPLKFIQDCFYAMKNLQYLSVALPSSFAGKKMDVTNLQISDETYDCIFCHHVFAHIPDDKKAMREIFRVLKRGGWAILQSSVDEKLEKTHEDSIIFTEEEKKNNVDQHHHIRRYGRDYVSRLEEVGFKVEQFAFAEELGPVMVKRCSLNQKEKIYFCKKRM